jgi:hypothetical protein
VAAFVQKRLQPFLRKRNGVGLGNADGIEAMLFRGLLQRGRDAGRIAQKSRLA